MIAGDNWRLFGHALFLYRFILGIHKTEKHTRVKRERDRSGSARQQQQSFLSFRSLSKLHLHCLLRWRAQFLEADAKAPKPTQICFFYYTRRQLFRCSVRSLAVLRRGEFARAFFTVNTISRGTERVPHRKAFKSCSAFVGSAGCTSLVVVFVQNALVTWLSPSKREVRHVRVTLLYAKQNEGDCGGVKLKSFSCFFSAVVSSSCSVLNRPNLVCVCVDCMWMAFVCCLHFMQIKFLPSSKLKLRWQIPEGLTSLFFSVWAWPY